MGLGVVGLIYLIRDVEARRVSVDTVKNLWDLRDACEFLTEGGTSSISIDKVGESKHNKTSLTFRNRASYI